MPNEAVLIFEDFPYTSEGRLFIARLHRALRPYRTQICEEKTVAGFENAVTNRQFAVLVLDIMAEPGDTLTWPGAEERVSSALTGVALLRRCRTGCYEGHCVDMPIYMRTARGETGVRQVCIDEGATDYFYVGAEDGRLVEQIRKDIVKAQEVCAPEDT
jgi:CheY-like chemotaxis protein